MDTHDLPLGFGFALVQNPDAMQRFAELPKELKAEMGRQGRARMEQHFSKKAVVAETMKGLGL